MIRDTVTWDDERWHQARLAAIERAYTCFTDLAVLHPLLDEWIAIAAARSPAHERPDAIGATPPGPAASLGMPPVAD